MQIHGALEVATGQADHEGRPLSGDMLTPATWHSLSKTERDLGLSLSAERIGRPGFENTTLRSRQSGGPDRDQSSCPAEHPLSIPSHYPESWQGTYTMLSV